MISNENHRPFLLLHFWMPPFPNFVMKTHQAFTKIHHTCDFAQRIPAKCHQTQMQQRSSRFNTFAYYLIAAELNQRRWRKSDGCNQPLPAATPGSLQQQQVRLINPAQTAPSARSSSPDEEIEDTGLRLKHGSTTKLPVQARLPSGSEHKTMLIYNVPPYFVA